MPHPLIIATPAPRRSFALPAPPSAFFTGDLFDRVVLFLHEHGAAFTAIECVARGTDRVSALAGGPALCICIAAGTGKAAGGRGTGAAAAAAVGADGGGSDGQRTDACVARIARLFCQSEVARTIPPEILTVEFVGVVVHEDSKVDT